MTITKPVEQAFVNHFRKGFLVLALAVMAGCGGGGGEAGAPAGVNTVPAQQAVQANYFAVTGDTYGMENATYLSCVKSSLGIVLRAAIASSMTDPDYKTVSRIDIASGAAIVPGVAYSLGSGQTPFPGNLYFFNGQSTTFLRTVGGTITFSRYGSNSGDRISGSYSAVVEDGGEPSRPTYTIAASFDFATDSYAAVQPAPASLALAAQPAYQGNCASCHSLGSYDQSAGGAADLALKGGHLDGLFAASQPGHQGITLSAGDIANLKVLLNTN